MNLQERNNKWLTLVILALFAVFLYFPVFLHLGSLAVGLWDESLFALRALHYYDHGEYMINFNQCEGVQEHMNTKLPFTTFLQVVGFSIFGVNELGLRIPIALLFVTSVFYLIYFFKKNTGSIFLGVALGAILVSSLPFVDAHMLRTGNQDVPFAIYILLSLLFFYRFTETKSWKHLLLFTFFCLAALLTKNLLTCLIFPGMLAFLLVTQKNRLLLRDHKIYVSGLIIIAVYCGTLFYFEWNYPGFFQRMWNYELMGRYTKTIENHRGGGLFYFDAFFQGGFAPFAYLMSIALLFLLDKTMSSWIRNLILLMFLVFLSYGLGISLSATKTYWYIAPLYPLGAMIASLGVFHFFTVYILPLKKSAHLGFIGFFIALLLPSYLKVIDVIYKQEPEYHQQFYNIKIKQLAQNDDLGKNFTIAHTSFGSSLFFTQEKFNRQGYSIDFARDTLEVYSNKIMTCDPIFFGYIQRHHKYIIIDDDGLCRSIELLD